MTLKITLNIHHPDEAEQAQELLGQLKRLWTAPAVSQAPTALQPPADTAQPLTAKEVRTALDAVVQKHSMDDGLDILRSFGAEKLSELPEERYADFLSVCQEAAA